MGRVGANACEWGAGEGERAAARAAGREPDHFGVHYFFDRKASTWLRFGIVRHGPGTPAFALDLNVPAFRHVEAILKELHGKKPLRVRWALPCRSGSVPQRTRRADGFLQLFDLRRGLPRPERFFRLSSFRDGLFGWAALPEIGTIAA